MDAQAGSMLPTRRPAGWPGASEPSLSTTSSPLGTPLMWAGPTPWAFLRARAGLRARLRLQSNNRLPTTTEPVRTLRFFPLSLAWRLPRNPLPLDFLEPEINVFRARMPATRDTRELDRVLLMSQGIPR